MVEKKKIECMIIKSGNTVVVINDDVIIAKATRISVNTKEEIEIG